MCSLVAGESRPGAHESPDVNPSDTSDVVAVALRASVQVATDAVEAARAAFPGWSATTPWQRAEVLDRAGTEVIARSDELGDLLAREEGKTLPEARGEVVRAGQILKYFAGAALQPHGHALDSVRPGIDVSVTREPVGIVTAITPWNFPMAIPAWKIAPALAFGNTVVLKPAELVPGSAAALVDILHRAGLPAGALNLVLGRGSVVGDVLTTHPDVDAVTFTGSQATGERILRAPAKLARKVQLELGGKNPVVVLDDADLATAVEVVVQGGFGSTGQRCTASSFVAVADKVHDAFVAAVQERLSRWTVGDARAAGTDMGPVVDESQLTSNLAYLDIARSEGGEVMGGHAVERSTSGFYMAPALVVGTEAGNTINREEVFGPVVSVVRVADYDEALAVANSSEMNLSAGIVTRDLAAASHFKRHSKAGMVMVNVPTAGVDFHVPFGGRGLSSVGPREQGFAAVDFFTVSKTAYTMAGDPA
ncbi:MAG: aldehyde dehydrogenase family protein [Candidatus Nanopelagicales bacterium]